MLQPGRKYSGGSGYRYGFNGQDKDNEVYGTGNLNTAEFWEYDTRIGRRWNIDPKPVIGISDYSVFINNPIWHNDLKGDTIFRPAWMSHTFEDPLKMILYKTPLGKQLLDTYSNSSTDNIYLYAFDLDKSNNNFEGENKAIMNTVSSLSIKNNVTKEGKLVLNLDKKAQQGAENQLKYINSSGFNFNTSATINIVGLNTTDNKYLDYDKYDLAFVMYHEIYAHIELAKTIKGENAQHTKFGNKMYTKGMGLYDSEITGGQLIIQGSEAWKVFKQILELKIKNGDGTETNKRDLNIMNQVDQAAAKPVTNKEHKKTKKG